MRQGMTKLLRKTAISKGQKTFVASPRHIQEAEQLSEDVLNDDKIFYDNADKILASVNELQSRIESGEEPFFESAEEFRKYLDEV